MNNLVSIITPCFNASNFLVECLDSVLLQKYENWELIIVDDFSHDESRFIISKYADKCDRIKPVFLDHNVGAAEARNIAIQHSKGRFIAFLDADDMWSPNKLDRQISFMLQNKVAFSFTSYEVITETGSFTQRVIQVPKKMTYHSYLKNTIIGCLTVVIDKYQIGDFKMPNIRSSHDMALWLLIMKRGYDAHGIDENLARYRTVSSSNSSRKWYAARDVWMVYRKHEKLSLLYSFWCFLNYVFNALKKRI